MNERSKFSSSRSSHIVAVVALIGGCGAPLRQARTSSDQPDREREVDSETRLGRAPCGGGWSVLFPGAGQLCTGKTGAGATLMALGAAELATGIAVASTSPEGVEHPGAAVPFIGFQDLWVYGIADFVLDRQRAARLPYVPEETLVELAVAPFNPKVLKQPDVWAGIVGLTAAGVGLSLLAGEHLRTGRFGQSPNLFGRELRPGVGYPLAALVGTALFEQVAIAEETAFRGYIQSDLTRRTNPTTGWLVGSLIFGATHALNALVLPGDQQARYLAVAVPGITLVGSYLGLSYRWHGYSLAPPVALHFWYDFLLSAVFFAADPQHSPLSASVAMPF
ncbi:MAG TPA: CPBP family intramembrane glutamic endopeptidase [Polyangia bacterium]|nr:CPBP family intramembrane glutamic endopeptidase [Polyangia bacterium]